MSTETKTATAMFERLGECLYRRGGKIYARVRVNGKPTWRSTETDDPKEARAWLKKWRTQEWMINTGIEPKGVVLHRKRVPVADLIDAYVQAGMPKRTMQPKAETTLRSEHERLRPVRLYFGTMSAASLTMDDCDKYREWRVSGGYFAANGEQKARLARLKKGNRSVDLELTILGNVLHLAVRRRKLERNPIAGRSRYTSESEIRHCREVAPTPESLAQIERWLRARAEHTAADAILFMAYSGLRISEAMSKDWEDVDWAERVIHVKRLKKGIFPWVPILPAMATLLEGMKKRSASHLLFPSPFDPEKPRCAINNRITAACKALGLAHTTPHGLRSYFVTQARMAGIDENVIAKLIGDKTGAAIIARTYGDVRPDHLLKQAQRIKLTMAESSIESSHPSPGVAPCLTVFPGVAESTEAHG